MKPVIKYNTKPDQKVSRGKIDNGIQSNILSYLFRVIF